MIIKYTYKGSFIINTNYIELQNQEILYFEDY